MYGQASTSYQPQNNPQFLLVCISCLSSPTRFLCHENQDTFFFFLSLGYETPPPNSFLKKKKNKTHLPDLTTYFKLNISVDRGPLQK